jgi:hypothetical protein
MEPDHSTPVSRLRRLVLWCFRVLLKVEPHESWSTLELWRELVVGLALRALLLALGGRVYRGR